METNDWENEDAEVPEGFWDDAPTPGTWRILVMPVKLKEVTRGGIVLAQQVQDNAAHLTYVGKVIKMGWLAGKHERLGGTGHVPHPDFPQVGDYVAYGRYAGQQMKFRGYKLLIINDDEILARVKDPASLQMFA